MKHLLHLIVLISIQAAAQNEHLGLGIKGGLTLGFNQYAYQSDLHDVSIKPDFSAGLSYRYTKKKFYLSNELMFSRRGAKSKKEISLTNLQGEKVSTETQKWLANQSYIDLNILPGLKVKRFIALAGTSVSINLKNESEIAIPNSSHDFDSAPVDIGVIASIGYLQPIKKTSLLFELRFSQYFLSSDFTDKLRQIQIISGFIF